MKYISGQMSHLIFEGDNVFTVLVNATLHTFMVVTWRAPLNGICHCESLSDVRQLESHISSQEGSL